MTHLRGLGAPVALLLALAGCAARVEAPAPRAKAAPAPAPQEAPAPPEARAPADAGSTVPSSSPSGAPAQAAPPPAVAPPATAAPSAPAPAAPSATASAYVFAPQQAVSATPGSIKPPSVPAETGADSTAPPPGDASAPVPAPPSAPASAPSGPLQLALIATPPAIAAGGIVTVDVIASSPGAVLDAPFHLSFDPSIVEFVDGTPGDFLTQGGSSIVFFADGRSRPGDVAVAAGRVDRGNGASGAGLLCRVRLRGIAQGTSSLVLGQAKAWGAGGRELPVSSAGTSVMVR